MDDYNKHYIRLDENNFVIKGFSNAFEEPLETDICICEDGGRHFCFCDKINPNLKDLIGRPLYKNNMELCTQQDFVFWDSLQPEPQPTELELLKEKFEILDTDAQTNYELVLELLGVWE